MSSARLGYGVTLAYGDNASPEVFTAIAELTGSLSGPNLSQDSIDVSHTASTSKYREFIGGLIDAGEITASFNLLLDTTQEQARTLLTGGTKRNWRLSFPVSPVETLTCEALVTGWNPSTPIDAQMTLDLTIKLSGVPTWA